MTWIVDCRNRVAVAATKGVGCTVIFQECQYLQGTAACLDVAILVQAEHIALPTLARIQPMSS